MASGTKTQDIIKIKTGPSLVSRQVFKWISIRYFARDITRRPLKTKQFFRHIKLYTVESESYIQMQQKSEKKIGPNIHWISVISFIRWALYKLKTISKYSEWLDWNYSQISDLTFVASPLMILFNIVAVVQTSALSWKWDSYGSIVSLRLARYG